MLTKKTWLRMVVSGLLLTGCGGGMEPVPGEGPQDETTADVHASTTTAPTTGNTPPPAVMISTRTDLRGLWPSTASVRKYVVLVAYTLPPDTTGYIAPPRFRAFGMDLATNQYLFTVDGERAGLLGSFSEAMLTKGAIVLATPPGLKFDGSCSIPVPTVSPSGVVTASELDGDCGTDPIVRSGGSTNTGGNDWGFSWMQVMNLPSSVSNQLGAAHYGALTQKMNALGASEAVEAQ